MKRVTRKLITVLLIIVTLFNYIYGNCFHVYGVDEEDELIKVVEGLINLLTNLLSGVVGHFIWMYKLGAMAIGLAVNMLTAQVAYADNAIKPIVITPFDIFFNKVQILDINFLDTNVGGIAGTIRLAVAKWYYIVRLISIAILLLILLYLGIRMAISSVSSEKALYKKALVDWSVSLALVFLLQYIVMFTVNVNSAIVEALSTVHKTSGVDGAILKIGLTALTPGWDSYAATIVYLILVFQTFVFLVKYMKRMLTIGFLIIISPLISITYSIDKLGDQKSQALNTWLKEFVYNVLIQPFHCVMYLAFVDVAFSLLADESLLDWGTSLFENQLAGGVVAILCMLFIDDGEKIIRKIFGFGQASSLTPLESAAIGGAVVKMGEKMPALAKNARKAINQSKENGLIAAVNMDRYARRNKSIVAAKTQEIMDNNEGITKQEATARAKREVWKSNEAIKKKAKEDKKNSKQSERSRKARARREDKIDKEMIKMLGGEAAFEKLKSRPEEFEKKRQEAAKEVDEREKKSIKNKAIGSIKDSELLKYQIKHLPAASVGIAIGGLALGGANLFTAYNTGKAAYKGVDEFAKLSTKTIAKESIDHVQGIVSSREELEDHYDYVYQNGKNGAYEEKSDDTKDLIDDLKAVLISAGEGSKLHQIKSNISVELLKNPGMFDLDDILNKALAGRVSENDEAYEKIRKAANNYAIHKKEGYFYKQIENAESLNISREDFIDRIDSQIDYSMAERSGGRNDAQPERIDVHNVVEHIQRTEKVEEVINKVDTADVDKIMDLDQSLQRRISEINKLDMDSRTQEINKELDKLNEASELLRRRIREAEKKD